MKKLLTLSIIITLSYNCLSQQFFHNFGLGVTYFTYEYDYTIPGFNNGGISGGGGGTLLYQAGLNFKLGKLINIAPTIYPSIGGGFISTGVAATPAGGGNGLTIFGELPVLAELYIGDREKFGGFLGVGLNTAWYSTASFIYGPQLSLGFHFNFNNDLISNSLGEEMTIRFAYTKPMNEPQRISGASYTKNEFRYYFSLAYLWSIGK